MRSCLMRWLQAASAVCLRPDPRPWLFQGVPVHACVCVCVRAHARMKRSYVFSMRAYVSGCMMQVCVCACCSPLACVRQSSSSC